MGRGQREWERERHHIDSSLISIQIWIRELNKNATGGSQKSPWNLEIK